MVGVVMMTVRLVVIVVAVAVMDNYRLTGLGYQTGPGLASRSVFITRMFNYDAVLKHDPCGSWCSCCVPVCAWTCPGMESHQRMTR